MQDSHDQEEGGASQERWMVSFADFITLMFAVFTVLYATSNHDAEKMKDFQESIKRYLIKAGAFGGSGDKINQGEKYNNPIEPPIQTYRQMNPLSQETFDEAEKYLDETLSEAEKKKYLYDVILDELGVRIVVSGKRLYAPNTTKFREDSVPFLEKLGVFLAKIGRRVMVEGHMASEAVSSPVYPSAWEFAGARATALVRYLVKRHKMEPAMFVPISYGTARPQPADKNQNERMEIVILTEDLPF